MPTRQAAFTAAHFFLIVVVMAVAACGGKKPPVGRPTPPPAAATATLAPRPPAPPEPAAEPTAVPPEPVAESTVVPPGLVRDDAIESALLDDLNRNSPLRPVFYDYNSAEFSAEAQATLNENASVLREHPTWVVTIEGHCDERGTAEYNLALGERRAVAARVYLVSLGISADRLRTVSYGKEFPFEPDHDEFAWSRNRRAHFVITAK